MPLFSTSIFFSWREPGARSMFGPLGSSFSNPILENCLLMGLIQESPPPAFSGPLLLGFFPAWLCPQPPLLPCPQDEPLPWEPVLFHMPPPSSSSSQLEWREAATELSLSPQPSCIDFEPDLMGLGEAFPQPVVFPPTSSGSPQPVGVSVGFPQAAVPLSTVGLVGEVPPQPDGPIAEGFPGPCPGLKSLLPPSP